MSKKSNITSYNRMLHIIRPYVKNLPRRVTGRTPSPQKGKISRYWELLFGERYDGRKDRLFPTTGTPLAASSAQQSLPLSKRTRAYLADTGHLGNRDLGRYSDLRRVPIPSAFPWSKKYKRGEDLAFTENGEMCWDNPDRLKIYFKCGFYYKNGKIGTVPFILQELRAQLDAYLTLKGELRKNQALTIAVGGGEEGGSSIDRGKVRTGSKLYPGELAKTAKRIREYIEFVLTEYDKEGAENAWIHGVYMYLTKRKKRRQKHSATQKKKKTPKGRSVSQSIRRAKRRAGWPRNSNRR